MPVDLVLADDHPLVLDGLESLLGREPDFRILDRCASGPEAVDAVRRHRPHVLVLDLRMPGLDGLGVLRELAGQPTRTVILTGELDEEEVLEAIRLGVRGVVLKEMAPRLLVACVRKVAGGGFWLEQRSVGLALERLVHREERERRVATVLTPRELEVVRAVAGGLRNKEVADRLHIAEGTVKIHLHAVYEKLQLRSRLELARYMREKTPA